MAKILNAILIVAIIPMIHYYDSYGQSWILAACMLIATTAASVRLKQPIIGMDIFAALLWFRAMGVAYVTLNWLFIGFAVSVFIVSIVLESVRRRFAVGLFTPAAAVAMAAIIIGRHHFGDDLIGPYDSVMPVKGAVMALLIGQAILFYIKENRLLRLLLPIAVVVAGWLVGSFWPPGYSVGSQYAVHELFGFFLPDFAIPAVAAVAIIEIVPRRQEAAT
jgi:hypothetical protein